MQQSKLLALPATVVNEIQKAEASRAHRRVYTRDEINAVVQRFKEGQECPGKKVSVAQLAKSFSIPYQTVAAWIKEWDETGVAPDPKTRGRKAHLEETQEKDVIEMVDNLRAAGERVDSRLVSSIAPSRLGHEGRNLR